MTDRALRSLERAAQAGDPEAERRLAVERNRLRDPRWDPARGDLVQGRGRTAFVGRYPGAIRSVDGTWPRRLGATLPVVSRYAMRESERARIRGDLGAAAAAPPPVLWLPVGAPVLAVKSWRRYWATDHADTAWTIWAAHRDGEPWVELESAEEPDAVRHDSLAWRAEWAPLAVEAVDWSWVGRHGDHKDQRSTINQWRRWARGGTVLRTGGAS